MIIFWTVAIALIGGVILFIAVNKNQNSIDVKNTDISISQTANSSKPITKNLPPVSKSIQQAQTYTLAEISTHNNQSSCWTIINGKIYDITSFISSHPAGVRKILEGCGIDATNLYGRVGAHDQSKAPAAAAG